MLFVTSIRSRKRWMVGAVVEEEHFLGQTVSHNNDSSSRTAAAERRPPLAAHPHPRRSSSSSTLLMMQRLGFYALVFAMTFTYICFILGHHSHYSHFGQRAASPHDMMRLEDLSNSLLPKLHYKPRMVRYAWDEGTLNQQPPPPSSPHSNSGSPLLSIIHSFYSPQHYRPRVYVPRMSPREIQHDIRDDSEAYDVPSDAYGDDVASDCQLPFDWQRSFRPNCNTLHEFDATNPSTAAGEVKYLYLAHGSYRDVWAAVDDVGRGFVYKPLRYKRSFTYRNMDRMRRDTIIMDRLTGSKYILGIYGACGTSGFFEMADGGVLSDTIFASEDEEEEEEEENADTNNKQSATALTQMEKLHIATQVAMALAAVHNIDREGMPTIAHTDINPDQFLKVGNVFKLNDFNRARFLKYSNNNGTVCPFEVQRNAGKNRSPEEYAYHPETEKVDVYSMGNIFYMLLQGEEPFANFSLDDVPQLVLEGMRPMVSQHKWHSRDPVDAALKTAMIMCHHADPSQRATARQVETFWKETMHRLDPGRLQAWGDA